MHCHALCLIALLSVNCTEKDCPPVTVDTSCHEFLMMSAGWGNAECYGRIDVAGDNIICRCPQDGGK